MSEEQLKLFLEKIKADSSLQNKLKAATKPEEVINIAKDAGFTVDKLMLEKVCNDLSEQDLEQISGGCAYTDVPPIISAFKHTHCC